MNAQLLIGLAGAIGGILGLESGRWIAARLLDFGSRYSDRRKAGTRKRGDDE
jgi:hypothetical protein